MVPDFADSLGFRAGGLLGCDLNFLRLIDGIIDA